MTQTDSEWRGLAGFRWTFPLLTLAGLAIWITSFKRYWYVGILIAVLLMLGYLQILRISKEAAAGRQAAERAKAGKSED